MWKILGPIELERAIERNARHARKARELAERRALKAAARQTVAIAKSKAKAAKKERVLARIWADVEKRAAERKERREAAAAYALAKKLNNIAERNQ